MASILRPRKLASLPEDIIHEILAICLTPTSFLTDCRAFGDVSERRYAALLLVCKQWYRVGMPLLYKYLRTRDQSNTKTILQVLIANPRLCMVVRNLRIEGGMGKELREVVSFLPNVKNLYISTSTLKAADSIAGLRRVMPIPSVEHLYYQNSRWHGSNKTEQEVDSIVVKALELPWESIKSVTFPDTSHGSSPLSDNLVIALQKLPHLEQLSFPTSELRRMLRKGRFSPLTKLQPLTRIQCLGELLADRIREDFERLDIPKELSDKVLFIRTRRDDEVQAILHNLAPGFAGYEHSILDAFLE